ncbi:MAG: hypothetical protein KDA86_24980 [Planctomycetaceae bacterium]|nr:hypothetical protein [Planctomycetaceae bacterium]
MSLELYHPGLEGVIAGETNISCVDGEFLYRGYSVTELADGASFLEVVHLLLTEELPTQEQLADFRSVLWDNAELPESARRFVHDLPLHVSAIDMLRTGVSLLGNDDPQLEDSIVDAGVSQATRLLARVPLLLAEWKRQRDGLPSVEPSPILSYAGNLLLLLTGAEPDPVAEQALTSLLILYADDALTPSTFAARIAASTGASLISAVAAAISTCTGSQFSQQFSAVHQLLSSVDSRDEAVRLVRYRVGESLPLPGFRSACDTGPDPRPEVLERWCRELAQESGREHREEIADAMKWAIWDATRRSPLLEWPATRLVESMGIDRDLHSALFVCARLAGWAAHIIEQAEEGDLIRPRSRYRGAERNEFEPLSERG